MRTGIQQSRLKDAIRDRPSKILNIQSQIIALKEKCQTYTEISKLLNISRGSVYNVLPKETKKLSKIVFSNHILVPFLYPLLPIEENRISIFPLRVMALLMIDNIKFECTCKTNHK